MAATPSTPTTTGETAAGETAVGEMTAGSGAVERRVARLEAAEHVRSGLARYSHFVDARLFDELQHVFLDDAEFVAVNFPPGNPTPVRRVGWIEIEPVCRNLPSTEIRHHMTNVSVDVSSDAKHARSSAYYLHTKAGGITGGYYEGEWRPDNTGTWRIATWHVTAGWGSAFGGSGYDYAQSLRDGTRRGGHPVVWDGMH